jgi:DeoR/GlpR family transcriptional regulator of sugar metabolism
MNKKPSMFRDERVQQIIERLLADKKVVVADLAEEFGVSQSSIRIDLAKLEARGLLSRTYGGAVLPDQLDQRLIAKKSVIQLREEALQAEKEAIGKAVADLIQDGETLMIDGGSTTLYVARNLTNKHGLSVVTNATNLLPDLLANPEIDIYLSGGSLNRIYETLVGEIAIDVLGRFRTSKAVIGIDGLSLQNGLTATDPIVAATKTKIISAAKELIVACDHTKLDKVCLMPIAPLEKVDVLVTDINAPVELVEEIRSRGPKVIIAHLTETHSNDN